MGALITQSWPGNPRAVRPRDRRPGEFKAYVPHPVSGWRPLLTADVAAFISEAERELRDTAGALDAATADGMFFWAESLGSSRIEGVDPSTRNVVHALARKEASPDREFHESVFQVVGNIEATNAALEMLADSQSLTL